MENSRWCTRETMEEDLKFVTATEIGKKDEEKMAIFLKMCRRDFATWLLTKEQVKTWNDLEKIAKSYNTKEMELEKLVKVIHKTRRPSDSVAEHAKKLYEELMVFSIEEESKVQIVGYNIMLTFNKLAYELEGCRNINQVLYIADREETRRATRRKMFCRLCKGRDHDTEDCNRKEK